MKLKSFTLSTLIFLLSSSCVSVKLSEPSRVPTSTTKLAEPIEIKINASYSAESLWTEAEIRNRFEITKKVFEAACPGIKLSLIELVRIEDKSLQDIDGSLSSESAGTMIRVLRQIRSSDRPVLLYVRRGKWDFEGSSQFTENIGKAYTLGGPRLPGKYQGYSTNDFNKTVIPDLGWQVGNLNWERFQELRPLHGVIIVGEGSSAKSPNSNAGSSDDVSTDRHELGHVLLNDGSHRDSPNNIMASSGSRTILDQDQCDIIRAYNELEIQRDMAIRSGMQQICSLFESKGITTKKPTYCR